MLSIQTLNIDKKDNLAMYNLNYPIITLNKEKTIINEINQKIYEDIISFKAAIEDILEVMPISDKHISYINTEYYISYNDNGIISIPIEFSQLDGLYNVSYINSYNYDINLEKEINLEDVFNSDIDYIKLITNKIESRINELEKELSIEQYIMVLDYLKDIILCDNPTFCICNDGIIICFSSYELDTSIPDITTFKITFEEDRSYFSNYIIERVLDGFKGDI
jgi:hypothetical protein